MTSTPEDTLRHEPPSINARLFGLSWSHFLNDGSANYLPGILPAVLISLHLRTQMAGALMGALLIGQAVQPVMGYIADRLGGRMLIVIGLLGSSIGGALLGLAQQVWIFVGLLFLIGLGNALFHPQALAAVRSLVRNRHGFNTSIFLVGGELGRGVWPTVSSFVVVHFGLPGLWVFAVPALITVPFLIRLAPRLEPKTSHGTAIHWRKHFYPLTILIGYAGIRSFMTYGVVTFIPLLWHFRGGSLIAGASIITSVLVIGVLGNLGGGHFADGAGRRPILLISVIGSALFIPLVVHAAGVLVWLLAGLLGILLFLSASTTVLIGQDIFPENRSLGSGIALGFANGIGALLVFIVGFWVNEADVHTVFWILAGAGIVSALFAFAFPRKLLNNET
ncbi:MFS transporter [Alicyclobacillus sp. SO9]|uniref:MFS transporter n=1 Tax=Alicyclobacillus sp. SO9 TaxID=2665646 RepID=UPI0018E8E080|nr:MFS transporter [Alicyclobacillus sp. SO9]QQE81041.1 MFS transporter [Alicyclobacillus sp. SO9]